MNMSNSERKMVAVRLVREADLDVSWTDLEIVFHLPMFVSGPLAVANIEKRISQLVFDTDASVLKVRWTYVGDEDGGWMTRPVSPLSEE
ncbi:MAG: hypothetical protein ACI9BD_001358 [Candidatus Marinamargulisbacteria bacterium]|jgi:hypothetical protein